jgi:predicted RNase H-related nuclease YkuK (DUF458 family)
METNKDEPRKTNALVRAVDFVADLPEHVFVILLLMGLVVASWFLSAAVTEDRVKQSYETRIEEVNRAHATALAQQTLESDEVITNLHVRVAEAQAQKQKTKTLIKEVTKYVTKEADARCTVPVGFVWLYNASLAGEVAGVPGSPPGDVDSPSGVKISEVAAVAGDNNAECVKRGKLIEAWQTWYVRNKDIYARAQKIIEAAVKK